MLKSYKEKPRWQTWQKAVYITIEVAKKNNNKKNENNLT